MTKRCDLLKRVLFIYGLAGAALYCALMPIWEGFDELFHYGYVQSLAHERVFPVIGQTRVPLELWRSLDDAPVSQNIQSDLGHPGANFGQYFEFSDRERRDRRRRLESIDQALQRQPSPRENYEAKQSPFTYLLLAPLELLLAGTALPSRVFTLRLFLSLTSIALTWIGMFRLGRRLELTEGMTSAALFIVFSCQMTYGTVCRVANDALLGPWLLFFLVAVIDAWESPTWARTATSAALMALGFLIKSSVIAFVPLVFVWRWRNAPARLAAQLAVLLSLAGPWSLRNVILYRNLLATPETSGLGPMDMVRAAAVIPWDETIRTTLHSALWKGNNSFTTLSESTLNIALALVGLGLVLYAARYRRSAAETTVLAAILLYCGALTAITLSFFVSTKGLVTAPMPWYMQILFAPTLAICFLGMSRWRQWGKWLAIANIALWAYIGAIGWLAKLVPFYGGFESTHAHFRELTKWYFEAAAQRHSILSALCPGPLWLIYGLLAAVIVLMAALTLQLLMALRQAAD
jgi:hypothetical protein